MRTTAARAQGDSRASIAYGRDVRRAVDRGQPVVALGSAIIAHALPWPENFDMACEFESIVREEGACPATIAVVDGQPRVGLDVDELARITAGPGVCTLGPRDLSPALAHRVTGATAVSTTAVLAARAGIRVFASAGPGFVHPQWTDVGEELAGGAPAGERTTVVRAGVRSILDVPVTRQRLESLNVAVLGRPVQWRVDDPARIASLMREQDGLAAGPTLLIATPASGADRGDREPHGLAAALTAVEPAVRAYLLRYLVRPSGGAPPLRPSGGPPPLGPSGGAPPLGPSGGAPPRASLAAVRAIVRLAAQVAVAWTDESWWPARHVWPEGDPALAAPGVAGWSVADWSGAA